MKNMDSPPSPSDEMILRRLGTVKNGMKKPLLEAGGDGIELRGEVDAVRERVRRSKDEISEIVIDKDMTDILHGIEEYSHIVVLYWAHKVPESGRKLTRVHPMGRAEIPAVGIFSTCSPARPNPVLTTVVRLRARKGNVLKVSGLDAVDGSPVIDIKPYVREFYDRNDVRIPGWMRQLCDEMRD